MYTCITLHLFYFFTHLFLVVLGLHCCAQDFCSCGWWGILFIAVLGLLTGGFSCCRAQALGAQASVAAVMHGLSSLGSVAVAHRLSCSAACGIFQTRDWAHVRCTGRPILIHGTIREVPRFIILFPSKFMRSWWGWAFFFCHQWGAQHRICGCECLLNVCSNPVKLSPVFKTVTLRLHLVGKVKWRWSV